MENLEQLVTAAQHGDSEAFNQLYEYSFSTVKNECMKVLHNSLDAEDAIQETYIRIYKRLSSLKNPAKFLGWCRMIAHNCSVDYIAHHQRKAGKDDYKPPVSYDDYSGMDQVNLEDTELTPEEQAEQKMVRKLLQEAMDSIPPQRATCLALYQQGNSYKEISGILSIPLGSVKSNVYYAKQALKEKIEKIEKENNIQVHGFTLVPIAGKVEVREIVPDGSGFIQASSSTETTMKNRIWENITQKGFHSGGAHGVWLKKIMIIIATLIVIAGGVIFALNYPGRQSIQNRSVTSSNSQTRGMTLSRTSVRRNQALNPNSRTNRQTAARSNQDQVRQATTARETQIQTLPAQTTQRSTREVYTF